MIKVLMILALAAPAIAIAEDAPAPTTPSEKRDAVVDQREQNQEKRIEQGEKSGQLTKGEAERLEKQQGRIKSAEEKAMADGKMSKQEYRKLERMQNRASRNIYRKKHNDRHN